MKNGELKRKPKMKKMAEAIAEGMGGSCDFDIHHGFPYLVNDDNTTQVPGVQQKNI